MFVCGHVGFGMDQLLASHPPVTDVVMVCPKRTVLCTYGGWTNWQCVVLIKMKRGKFGPNVLHVVYPLGCLQLL